MQKPIASNILQWLRCQDRGHSCAIVQNNGFTWHGEILSRFLLCRGAGTDSDVPAQVLEDCLVNFSAHAA